MEMTRAKEADYVSQVVSIQPCAESERAGVGGDSWRMRGEQAGPCDAIVEEVTMAQPTRPTVTSWRGVPIMPKAIAVQEKEGVYSYRIDATVDQVRQFYDTEMSGFGWRPGPIGALDIGGFLLG
jgi:hypothetical protein